ncbi:hypothetical protein AVEN_98192-1 [Araneus ventricosus]|uniref:DUF4817 domain-containing protein n=1 Tax=Araneus ventricosus TaxID=182803 RepID=A0A4Y2HJF4_ARAVE|nr:hypothetical protein AVEN_98192-1 [Araneus ventricosus]
METFVTTLYPCRRQGFQSLADKLSLLSGESSRNASSMNKPSPLTSFCTCLRSTPPKQDGLFASALAFSAWLGLLAHRTLTHWTFSSGGHMKSLVHETPVNSAADLVARIAVAADKFNTTPGIFERVRQSFLRRCELCNDTRGRHFEHLL